MTTPAPDFRALCKELVDELNYHADEHSVDELIPRARTALATPPPELSEAEAWQEFIEQVQRAQHVAIREGESPRFDLVECALALWREATPPPKPSEPPTDEERLADFAQWLAREMPPSTIIGDPLWWAPRIARAVLERWGK